MLEERFYLSLLCSYLHNCNFIKGHSLLCRLFTDGPLDIWGWGVLGIFFFARYFFRFKTLQNFFLCHCLFTFFFGPNSAEGEVLSFKSNQSWLWVFNFFENWVNCLLLLTLYSFRFQIQIYFNSNIYEKELRKELNWEKSKSFTSQVAYWSRCVSPVRRSSFILSGWKSLSIPGCPSIADSSHQTLLLIYLPQKDGKLS